MHSNKYMLKDNEYILSNEDIRKRGKPLLNKNNIHNIHSACKYCNRAGNKFMGMCEIHAEVYSLKSAINQWIGFLENATSVNKKIMIYRTADDFLFRILGILPENDKMRDYFLNYRQENLEKISELIALNKKEEPQNDADNESIGREAEENNTSITSMLREYDDIPL